MVVDLAELDRILQEEIVGPAGRQVPERRRAGAERRPDAADLRGHRGRSLRPDPRPAAGRRGPGAGADHRRTPRSMPTAPDCGERSGPGLRGGCVGPLPRGRLHVSNATTQDHLQEPPLARGPLMRIRYLATAALLAVSAAPLEAQRTGDQARLIFTVSGAYLGGKGLWAASPQPIQDVIGTSTLTDNLDLGRSIMRPSAPASRGCISRRGRGPDRRRFPHRPRVRGSVPDHRPRPELAEPVGVRDHRCPGAAGRRGDHVGRRGLPCVQPGVDLALRAGQRRPALLQPELDPDGRLQAGRRAGHAL